MACCVSTVWSFHDLGYYGEDSIRAPVNHWYHDLVLNGTDEVSSMKVSFGQLTAGLAFVLCLLLFGSTGCSSDEEGATSCRQVRSEIERKITRQRSDHLPGKCSLENLDRIPMPILEDLTTNLTCPSDGEYTIDAEGRVVCSIHGKSAPKVMK